MKTQRKKITQTACDKAPPDMKLWDTEIKGFGLFTGKTKKTFYLQRTVHQRTMRTKIGNFPDVSAGVARGEALRLAAEHATGSIAKRLAAESKMPTLEEATETYIARPKLRSEQNKVSVKAMMHGHLKSWLAFPLDEITKAMCVTAHARITQRGDRIANHTLKSFRSIYNHARRVHDLPECPTIAIEWHTEKPSRKIIDDLDEWKRVVDQLENPVHSAFYRFLLFTGLRLNEALPLRWDQVRDDHLHLPMTKNGREFNLPLLDVHHEILEPLRIYRSDYVFHGKRQVLHLKSPERLKWSAHAHRRTFASVAAADADLFEDEIGRLLNHTPTSVTGRHYIVVPHDKLHKTMCRVVDAFKRKHLI